jgi:hypothetical protein
VNDSPLAPLFLAAALAAPWLAPVPLAAQGEGGRAAANEVVWHWFGACAGHDSLELTVTFDGQLLFRSTFQICHQRRADIKPDPQERILEFRFTAPPSRFRAHSSRDAVPITADVWEAGGETSGIRLGISFSSDAQVLINTIHTARAQAASRSEQVRGMVIATRPVTKGSH